MSTRSYQLPIEQTQWRIPSSGEVHFDWEYDEGRDKLLNLYEKGKKLQWNSNDRIDWSLEIDFDDPLKAPPVFHPLHGTDAWARMDDKERGRARLHGTAWQFSQFLHGEQGALICAAKIVETVPSLDAKYYAATQVMDEARHVEVYSRYLNEKLGMTYPINRHLETLLGQVLGDSRWDMTYLGMQILIEGLALAAFGSIRDFATDPLAVALTAYVMQDEARHVAFGRFALRDYYPQLTESERAEREEFCVEACYLMRDRFLAEEVWKNLGLGDGVIAEVSQSRPLRDFRTMLFSRIVPSLKEIGLWGRKIRKAFEDMGVMTFADVDLDALGDRDHARAEELDAEKRAADENIAEVAALGQSAD